MTPEFQPGTFPDYLDVRDVNGSRDFELLAPFRYQYTWGNRPLRPFEIFVPKGTPWNGASIPPFFWRVMGSPFVGKHRKPSVIHDYLWAEAKAGRHTYQGANWVFWHALMSVGPTMEEVANRGWWRRLAWRAYLAYWPVKAWLMWCATAFNAWRIRWLEKLKASPRALYAVAVSCFALATVGMIGTIEWLVAYGPWYQGQSIAPWWVKVIMGAIYVPLIVTSAWAMNVAHKRRAGK